MEEVVTYDNAMFSHYTGILEFESERVAISGGYDYGPVLQAAIEYVMTNGGGTVILPPGDFRTESMTYSHLDSYDSNDNQSPIAIIGATPVYADLFNSKKKNVTRLIKKSAGTILGINFTPTKAVAVSGVWRNLTIRNIAFYGVGSFDEKYTNVFKSTSAIDAIEMRNSSIVLEDCFFWGLRKGVAQPATVNGYDNYCDQSTYNRLGFTKMGTTWLELQRPDASTIDNIYGYDMARTCQNGVYVRKAESLEVGKVLCAGKSMHLAQDFKLVNFVGVKSAKIGCIYGERIEGLLINLENDCADITISEIGARQYGKTHVKARNSRNIKIETIHTHLEEGKVLSPNDTGDFQTYDTLQTLPPDIDVDASVYNLRIGQTTFRNGVHQADGTFTETTLRTVPRMTKSAKGVFGIDDYIIMVYHNGTSIVARAHGVDIEWSELCGSAPTYNATTGEFTFPAGGIFGNSPAAIPVGRRHPTTGVRNVAFPSGSNPFKVDLLTTADQPVATTDVAFNILVKF